MKNSPNSIAFPTLTEPYLIFVLKGDTTCFSNLYKDLGLKVKVEPTNTYYQKENSNYLVEAFTYLVYNHFLNIGYQSCCLDEETDRVLMKQIDNNNMSSYNIKNCTINDSGTCNLIIIIIIKLLL